ncbi:hypothetical protein CHARACLAT_028846 [Characodon lateralis]|uniref:Uncharacterized protein n=1 Tax=Characodon lateralis TaxID=208331 RepID=A0ABU7E544_9TELE|nr:hypothetical protein [Characodon lateralis]
MTPSGTVSQSEGRTTGPHHCGYGSNVEFGSYRSQLKLTFCLQWMLSSNFIALDSFSSAGLLFGLAVSLYPSVFSLDAHRGARKRNGAEFNHSKFSRS